MTNKGYQQCHSCDEILPLSDFHRSPRTSTGHTSVCKSCISIEEEKRRAQPGYRSFTNAKAWAKKYNVNYDPAIFKDYKNFWNTFSSAYLEAEKQYGSDVMLRVDRINGSMGFFKSNIRFVPRKRQPIRLIEQTTQEIETPQPPVQDHIVELYEFVANKLGITGEQVRKCQLKGHSLSFLETLCDNINDKHVIQNVIDGLLKS